MKPAEAIWDWAREEVTGNACLGTKAKVEDKMGQFFQRLAGRTGEVKPRYRTVLQAEADALTMIDAGRISQPVHVDFTLGLV